MHTKQVEKKKRPGIEVLISGKFNSSPKALNVTKDVFLCELKAIIQHENSMNLNIYTLNYTAATLRKQKIQICKEICRHTLKIKDITITPSG